MALRRPVGLEGAAAISPPAGLNATCRAAFQGQVGFLPQWKVRGQWKKTQSVSRYGFVSWDQRSGKTQTFLSVHGESAFLRAKLHSKFSKCAERLLFMFPFIVLSRIRGQMEETGGVDNGGFDVLSENMRASLLTFHQTSCFSGYATPRYESRVNHTPCARLQIWMFSQRLT